MKVERDRQEVIQKEKRLKSIKNKLQVEIDKKMANINKKK